jgi:hypothetical protein
LNPFGFGKFEITPTNSPIKAVFQSYDLKVESLLPLASDIGIALEVNNFSYTDQAIVKVKTNWETIPLLKDKELYVVVHQDDKKSIIPLKINLENLEQTMSIANKFLSEGINTIRIIDSDLKQWCERVTYVYPKEDKSLNIMFNFKKEGKITAYAKICFSCYKNYIVLEDNRFENFQIDYEDLDKLLKELASR